MKKHKRGLLIIVILIMFIGIGYAFLNAKLTINGTSNFSANSWLIYFDEIRANANNTAEATEPAIITNEAKTNISFDVNLEKPGEFYEFDVYIKNDGTIDAMIDEVIMPELTEEEKKYMTFSYTYADGTKIKKCDELKSHGYRDTRLRVEYLENGELDLVPEDSTRHFDVTITYVQTSECELDEIEVDLDPNGGIYNDTTEVTSVTLSSGRTYTVGIPTRDAYTFAGWEEITDTNSYANSTVTFNGKNVRLRAKWVVSEDVVARIDRTESMFYVTIQSAIDDARSGETIYLLKDTVEEFTNNKNVVIDLQGHTVTGSGLNQSGYSLTLINGSIENTDGVSFVNKGTLTLGIDDDNLCELWKSNVECTYENGFVSLIGSTQGIKQEGVFNFYDGFVEGEMAILGGVTKTPVYEITGDNETKYYRAFVDKNEIKNNQKMYLRPPSLIEVSMTTENGNVYYKDLSDNFDTSAITGYKIYAIRDFEAPYVLNVPAGSNIEFDISGYNVNVGNVINNKGTLALEDSSNNVGELKLAHPLEQEGTISFKNIKMTGTSANENLINNKSPVTLSIINSTLTSLDAPVINNTSELTLDADNNSNLSANQKVIETSNKLVINNAHIVTPRIAVNQTAGELIIKNGYFERTYAEYSSFLINSSAGTIDVKNGEFKSVSSGFNGGRQTEITIDNINLTVASYANRAFENVKKLTINDGYIKGGDQMITECNVTMNGGTIYSDSYNNAMISGHYYGNTFIQNGGDIILESRVNNGGIYIGIDYYIMNGGTITSSNIGFNGGNVTIVNGTVDAKYIGVNGSNLTMTGGTVKGGSYGIRVVRNNTVNLKRNEDSTKPNPIVSGGAYGIIQEDGTLNLGDNTEESPNKTEAIIIGGSYGLYKTGGTFNFNDGIFKGAVKGIEGIINSIPEGYITNEADTEVIDETTYHLAYLFDMDPFLQVGEHTYNSFNKLFDEEEELTELTIEVIDDGIFYNEQTIPENKKVTLKLNGYTINTTKTITNNADLTIKDTKVIDGEEEKYNGTLKTDYDIIINNKNKITINGGNYIAAARAFYQTTGEMIINDGYFERTSAAWREPIIYSATGSITVNGGKFESISSGLNGGRQSELVINNIDLTAASYGNNALAEFKKVTIEGGYIKGGDQMISECNVTMNGGTIYSDSYNNAMISGHYYGNTFIQNGGDIILESRVNNGGIYIGIDYYIMNGGTITSSNIGFNGGNVTIVNGIVDAKYIGVNGSNLTMTGGTVTGDSYGIYVARNTTSNIKRDENLSKPAPVVTGGTYGIYQVDGTLNLGENTETVPSRTDAIINGGTHGLYKTGGTFNFYDGIFKGTTKGIEGIINSMPEGYIVKETDTEEIDETLYHLAYLNDMDPFLQVGEHTYNSFNKLFAEEDELDELTIEVIGNGSFYNEQTIPANKKVTLKLNGYTLNTTKTITNNADLTIKDTKVIDGEEEKYNGLIETDYDIIINNKNKLTISGGNYIAAARSFYQTTGEMIINDGYFKRTFEAYRSPIIYSETGYMTINGGKFESVSSGLAGGRQSELIINNIDLRVNSYGNNALSEFKKVTIEDGYIKGGDQMISECNVTMNGGTIYSDSYNNAMISGHYYGNKFTMNNGEIILVPRASDGSIYIQIDYFEMNGGTITSTKTGLYKTNLTMTGGYIYADIYGIDSCAGTITGGTIEGGTYGIKQDGSTITLGVNEENGTPNKTTPKIIGGTYGLYKTGGTFNFYDGIIEGVTAPVEGPIDNIADASFIETGLDTKTVDEEVVEYITNYLEPEYLFIRNTTQSKDYANFKLAMSEAHDNDKFEMFEDGSTYDAITIDKSIEIDFNGNDLSFSKGLTIDTDKVVTFKAPTANSSSIKSISPIVLITNNGILTVDSVDISNAKTTNYIINNNKELHLKNLDVSSVYGIKDTASSTTELISTNITANSLVFNSLGTLNVNHGILNTAGPQSYFVSADTTADVTINDITSNSGINNKGNVDISNSDIAMYTNNQAGATLEYNKVNQVQDGVIVGSLITNKGTFRVKDGSIKANYTVLCVFDCTYTMIANTGVLNIDGTEIEQNNSQNKAWSTIYHDIDNELVISNASIKNDQRNRTAGYAIQMTKGSLTLSNSKLHTIGNDSRGILLETGNVLIKSDGNEILSEGVNAYAVYANTNNAEVTLGEAEATTSNCYKQACASVNQASPLLKGIGSTSGYGMYKNNGYYNFYDGKLVGSTQPYNDTPSHWEKDWEAHLKTDEEYDYSILEFMTINNE